MGIENEKVLEKLLWETGIKDLIKICKGKDRNLMKTPKIDFS